MKKTEVTYCLNVAATELGLERDELLYFVAGESKPLGRLPFIPNHGDPDRIKFTLPQIEFIKGRLKSYRPEPLDFEAIDRIFERL